MKTFLTIFILFIISSVFSQSWCDPGANWKYDAMTFGIEGYTEIKYVGDTVIDGQSANILDKHSYVYDFILSDYNDFDLGRDYTYADNGVVYIRYNNQWDTLYNFNAQVGDSWKMAKQPMTSACDTNNILTVTATGTKVINAITLDYVVVDFSYSSTISDTIVEKIGFTGSYMLPYDLCEAQLDGNEGGPFRCYSDDNFATYNPNFEESCDFIVGVEENNLNASVKLIPNPANDIIEVTGLSNIKAKYSISDSSGKHWPVDKINNQIQIHSLKSGVYVLNIYHKNGVIHKRFIKQ